MSNQDIRKLLQQYINGTCSDEDRKKVEAWYEDLGKDSPLDLPPAEIKQDLADVFAALPKPAPVRSLVKWKRIAAAIIIVLGVGVYFYSTRAIQPQPIAKGSIPIEKAEIAPGENKAILTLADGSRVVLDNTSKGEVAVQNGISITKSNDGMLIYNPSSSQAAQEVVAAFNTVSTPKGGQYAITLPDGSKVWLNAASSLKYPIHFDKKERIVELSGEGYFEIAKSISQPFKVKTDNQLVEVLGTHFNINSYSDESSVRTTLLEGAVKIYSSNTGNEEILQPGQQSTLIQGKIQVAKVDTQNAVAWKNGFFYFDGSDIQSVMRQFSRWYNVVVEFDGKVPDIKLWGKVYRNDNASKALELLSYFNLKYRIEEKEGIKKIIILN